MTNDTTSDDPAKRPLTDDDTVVLGDTGADYRVIREDGVYYAVKKSTTETADE